MTQPAERLLDYGFAGREMTDTDARLWYPGSASTACCA